MEEDEADNEVERLLESDLNNDDESTIDVTVCNSNLPSNAAIFSVTDHAMVEFIQCCNQARTPINLLDELLGILKRHIRQVHSGTIDDKHNCNPAGPLVALCNCLLVRLGT